MNDLDTAMKDVAEHVDVPAHFAAAVLRGGKRRQARRRRAVAAAVVAVMGVAGVGVNALERNGPPGDSRLATATQGDLAGDQELIREAIEVWRNTLTPSWKQSRSVDGLVGDPYAYWAGSTSAGDAVVVMQKVLVKGAPRILQGLVATDVADGTRKVVGEYNDGNPAKPEAAYQFGPGDRTFLVVAAQKPVYASPSEARQADGQVRREWTRLAANGDVAAWTTPDGVGTTDVRLVVSQDAPTTRNLPERVIPAFPASDYLPVPGGLPRQETSQHDILWFSGPNGPAERLGEDPAGLPRFEYGFEQALVDANVVDINENSFSGIVGNLDGTLMVSVPVGDRQAVVESVPWRLRGTAADGSGVQVAQVVESRLTRLYAVISDQQGRPTRVVRGPGVDPASPLPVKMRLPDGKGWAVAAYGSTLRYRNSESAPWQDLANSGGLVPDDTTQVLVTPKTGGAGEVVVLPR